MNALDIDRGQAYEAHPVADLFPMLADDELAELAADITERGLLQPIILDCEGRILDGRNRLAACHMAGIEPRFETYDGDDPDGYALAVNIARRHLTKGQIAMVAARARSRMLEAGTGDLQSEVAREHGVSRQRVSQATVVLDHAPDLADAVVSGATSLDKAYEQARENKRQADSTEAKMLRLRCDAADLADLVIEERLSLDGAIRELDQRQAEAAAKAKRVSESLRMSVNTLTKAFGSDDLRAQAAAIYVASENGSEVNQNITPDVLRAAADICDDLAKRWEQ